MQGWPQNTKVLKKTRVLSRQCQITFYGVCTDIMLFQKLKHVWKIIYKTRVFESNSIKEASA